MRLELEVTKKNMNTVNGHLDNLAKAMGKLSLLTQGQTMLWNTAKLGGMFFLLLLFLLYVRI